MKMKNTICSSLLLGGLTLTSQAAVIAWTTADITDINDVITTGTTVTAQNYSGTGAPATVTVAGIDFTENNSLSGNFSGDIFALATGDVGYDTFLGDIDFNSGAADSTETISLSVTDGQQYILQVWYADDNTTGRVMTLTGSGGDNVLQGDDFAVGTFTADSTSQDLIITMSGGASNNGVRLTGYQLRAVPEPSSVALLGFGAVGFLLRRRR